MKAPNPSTALFLRYYSALAVAIAASALLSCAIRNQKTQTLRDDALIQVEEKYALLVEGDYSYLSHSLENEYADFETLKIIHSYTTTPLTPEEQTLIAQSLPPLSLNHTVNPLSDQRIKVELDWEDYRGKVSPHRVGWIVQVTSRSSGGNLEFSTQTQSHYFTPQQQWQGAVVLDMRRSYAVSLIALVGLSPSQIAQWTTARTTLLRTDYDQSKAFLSRRGVLIEAVRLVSHP